MQPELNPPSKNSAQHSRRFIEHTPIYYGLFVAFRPAPAPGGEGGASQAGTGDPKGLDSQGQPCQSVHDLLVRISESEYVSIRRDWSALAWSVHTVNTRFVLITIEYLPIHSWFIGAYLNVSVGIGRYREVLVSIGVVSTYRIQTIRFQYALFVLITYQTIHDLFVSIGMD